MKNKQRKKIAQGKWGEEERRRTGGREEWNQEKCGLERKKERKKEKRKVKI